MMDYKTELQYKTNSSILALNQALKRFGCSVEEATEAFGSLSTAIQCVPLVNEDGKPYTVGERDQEIVFPPPIADDYFDEPELPDFTHYCGYCGNFFHPLFVSCVCCGGRAQERILIEDYHLEEKKHEKNLPDYAFSNLQINNRFSDDELKDIAKIVSDNANKRKPLIRRW